MANKHAEPRQESVSGRLTRAPAAGMRAMPVAASSDAAKVLQRRFGNQGTQALLRARLGGEQAGPAVATSRPAIEGRSETATPQTSSRGAISQPGDALEQQAERVADQVVRMPQPAAPVAMERASVLQRSAAGPAVSETVPLIVHDVLRSPGRPLDAETRAFMEPRFEQDFGDVRVHSGDRAGEVASSINARAFTSNRSIVFGAGEYAPQTQSGRQLLAHELTHVVQQRSGAQLKDGLGQSGDAYEQQADATARDIVAGQMARATAGRAEATSATTTVQRQEKSGDNAVGSRRRSEADPKVLVAQLKARLLFLANQHIQLNDAYKAERLGQLQAIPSAGKHVHEALAFLFLQHNQGARIKSMNKDVVGIDVTGIPSWQKPDFGRELFIVQVDYSTMTPRQLAELKAKRSKGGDLVVYLKNATSQQAVDFEINQLGGVQGEGAVWVNPDAELIAGFKKQAAFTRAMRLAQDASKTLFLTGPDTLWFVRNTVELHPEAYREFLWRSGGVPESEIAEVMDPWYKQAVHTTGQWIASFDSEAPREAPFLVQCIADLNPLMSIAKLISLAMYDKPLYAMPGTKATTVDWVEGWVGLVAGLESIFGDLLSGSIKAVQAAKVVNIARKVANPLEHVSSKIVGIWAKDEVVQKIMTSIMAGALDKVVWEGIVHPIEKKQSGDKQQKKK